MQLNETRFWPVVKAAGIVVLCAGFVALILLVGLPALRGALVPPSATQPEPVQAAATPAPVTEADSRPISTRLQSALPQALDFTLPQGATVAADPSIYNGQILFCIGMDATRLTGIIRVEPASGTVETLTISPKNDSLRNPVEDGATLAYFDADSSGGGAVYVLDKSTNETRLVCQVGFGVPKLYLSAPYLAFAQRISDTATRLNVFNLESGAAVAPAMLLSGSGYDSSAISLDGATLTYADMGQDGGSAVHSIQLDTGNVSQDAIDGFVHNLQRRGNRLAWLSASLGEDSDLYLAGEGGTAGRIARDVANFYLGAEYVAYGCGETIYACALDNNRTYILNAAGTTGQLVAADDSLILWRDVTDPQSPIWTYFPL